MAAAVICSSPVADAATTAALGPFSVGVPPGGFEEHCLQLAAGERVHYRFSASGAVDFNLHYHRGEAVFYPVRKAQVRRHVDDFTAPHADAYCLMWESKATDAVRVEGAVERVRR
jgi:hypothetical protein